MVPVVIYPVDIPNVDDMNDVDDVNDVNDVNDMIISQCNDDEDVIPIIAIIGSCIVSVIVNTAVIIVVVVVGVNVSVSAGVATANDSGSSYDIMLVVLYFV